MSPFIRRVLHDEPEPSKGKISRPHEFYVPRAALQHGDVILDPKVSDRDSPKFIRDAVLEGLAVQFPKEFGAAAAGRGLTRARDDDERIDDDADDEHDEEDGGDDELAPKAAEAARIGKLGGAAILAALGACDDVDVLAVVRELEEARAKPRAAVLEALTAKGI